MIKASVIGATGFSGIELVRLLLQHPDVELSFLCSVTYENLKISEVYPHLQGRLESKLVNPNELAKIVDESDVIFTALPHGHLAGTVEKAYQKGKKVIDLGADFRLDSPEIYEEWYKSEHAAKDLIPRAVYGLPEVNRDKIKKAGIIANPGCYPTSVILALFPLLKENLMETTGVIIDSKSGVSGAGRKEKVQFLYSTCNESIAAYGVLSHRHLPEMEQELAKIAGGDVTLIFTPHLTPMTRGILSTIYVKLKKDCADGEIRELYKETYSTEPFVVVQKSGVWPRTKWVAGTNRCFVNMAVDKRTGYLVVVSAIDNLIKGAAGQAVQNMNILFGLAEEKGLSQLALYP